MDNIYFISTLISITFLIFKIIDVKIVKKSDIVIKYIIRDSLLVFLSVICGLYLSEQIGEINVLSLVHEQNNVSAFTNQPEF
jgi:hypothetical protein|tara:strand:- start:333 stop:578 length:246 start_codon:yes stop_codon:yes gene_type:complete